jgi:hypothetical protein
MYTPDAKVVTVGNEDISLSIDYQPIGMSKRGAGSGTSISTISTLLIAHNRSNDSGFGINSAYAVVGSVGKVDVPELVDGYPVGVAKPGLGGKTAVAAEPFFAVASNGRNDSGVGINEADAVVSPVGNKKVPL